MTEKLSYVMSPSAFQQPQSDAVTKTDKQQLTNKDSAITRGLYLKHLAGISLGVLCILTSYCSLFYIQSSLHSRSGLGTMALTVDYTSHVVTSLFVPSFLMSTIGCKWSVVVSGLCFAVFIAANLIASFETLLPAAVFMGTGFSVLRTTMNTVVSDLALGYARVTGGSEVATLSRFFSIFYTVITSAHMWANLITGEILSSEVLHADVNDTLSYGVCGAKFCNVDESYLQGLNSTFNNARFKEVPQTKVVQLVAAGLTTDGLGIILTLILLSSYELKGQKISPLNNLLATFRLLRNPDILLLTVITFNSGLLLSFLTADFTQAFVTCSIGIQKVGLVIMCYGFCVSLGSLMVGFVAPSVPRFTVFLFAALLNVADLLVMLFWTPNPDMPVVFYIIAVIWGVAFSVWASQLCALYGIIFSNCKQEAFSNHRIFEGLGFAVGFAWSNYFCMSTKIYIVLGVLLTGYMGYAAVERRQKRVGKN